MLSWHYIWSEDYAFFHHLLQDSVKDSGITLKPTFIEQSIFNKGLNQKDGHPLLGCLIKIDFFIHILKSTMNEVGNEPYIFFTDTDIIVKPGIYDVLKPHMDRGETMVFLKEGGQISANIGVILFKVCPEVIEFWELVRARGLDDCNRLQHLDQDYANDLLREYPGTWSLFDESKFCCSNVLTRTHTYVLVQILSSNIHKDFHVAEKIFAVAQFGVNMEKYMKHVPEHIIQKIYEFQEILAANYRRRKTTGAS